MLEKTYPITEKLVLNALQLVDQLHRHLIQEADALKKAQNAELINAIAAAKKQLVIELELFSNQCGQVLATEKLSNNQQGMAEYFQRADTAGLLTNQLTANWDQIQSLCAECRTLNDQNGASIALLSRHASRSLQLLSGKTHASNTYGPDGSTKNELYTSTLISV